VTVSEAKKEAAGAPHYELATRIYVELVARNVQIVDGQVKMAASPANLAGLSLKLAEAFVQADAEATAAKAPVTTYKVSGDDIAAWTTK
jgi:hypothetical protein